MLMKVKAAMRIILPACAIGLPAAQAVGSEGIARVYSHYLEMRLKEPEGGKRERVASRFILHPGSKCGFSRWQQVETGPERFASSPTSSSLDYLGDCSFSGDTLRAEVRLVSSTFPIGPPDSLLRLIAVVRESVLTESKTRNAYRLEATPSPALIAQGDIYRLSICKDPACLPLSDKFLSDVVHIRDSLFAGAGRDRSSYRKALANLERVLTGPLEATMKARFREYRRRFLAKESGSLQDPLRASLGKSLEKLD